MCLETVHKFWYFQSYVAPAYSTSTGEPDARVAQRATITQRPRAIHKPQLRQDTVSDITVSKYPQFFSSASAMQTQKEARSQSYNKLSIAAGTIVVAVALAAFLFLAAWYYKRARRAKRLTKLANRSQDPFDQSTLSLTENSSKTLDDFLMKDVQPERTSLMFSRSRSPSITFVVDEASRRNSTRFYRNSGDASTHSLSKLDPITRVSTEGTRQSTVPSEPTQSSSNTSGQQPSNGSPRVSMCSTAPPTARSSQLWVTTTGSTATTELSSIFSKSLTSSHTSNSAVRSPDGGVNLNGPQLASQVSNASRTSSRDRHLDRPPARLSNEGVSAGRAQGRPHRHSLSAVISPADET